MKFLLLLSLLLLLPSNSYVVEKEPEIITATTTAYSELDSCHNPKCLTAAGIPPTQFTIACPRKYPLFTRIEIGDKTFLCHDRTALRYDGRFDIWLGWGKEAHREALRFGKRQLAVKIYE